MGNYKEIVTKAILDKNQKDVNLEYTLPMNEPIDNVLGCWVINHKFSGSVFNNSVIINGEYDINIWYSYNGNSKTNVIIKNFTYHEQMDLNLNNSIAVCYLIHTALFFVKSTWKRPYFIV